VIDLLWIALAIFFVAGFAVALMDDNHPL